MKSWQPICCLTIGIRRYPHTKTHRNTIIQLLCPHVSLKILQLDEGINLSLKPRPGSDLTNSNAPSPPHKVQRSVSSTQKPVRKTTDQGESIGRFCGSKPHTHACSSLQCFPFIPQVHTRKGLREKTSMEWRILEGKVQVAPPKFHPVQ